MLLPPPLNSCRFTNSLRSSCERTSRTEINVGVSATDRSPFERNGYDINNNGDSGDDNMDNGMNGDNPRKLLTSLAPSETIRARCLLFLIFFSFFLSISASAYLNGFVFCKFAPILLHMKGPSTIRIGLANMNGDYADGSPVWV